MNIKYKTNFFTCCNDLYADFAPIFALSSLYHNDDIIVETGFETNDSIIKLKNQINFINNIYPNKFIVRQVPFARFNHLGKKISVAPNTIRFIETPTIKTDYVYISDIDIICLERNVSSIHIDHITKNKLDYSNIIRENTKNSQFKRMTGLHFTKWENYYPINNFSKLENKGILSHDEVFLFEILKERGLKIDYKNKFRPIHGIHASPNRDPNGKLNWGIKKWKNNWIAFRNSSIFFNFEILLSDRIKNIIKIIDKECNFI